MEIGDLAFKKGDLIEVEKEEGDWWMGRRGGDSGIFPSNYVEKITL
jgi:hypothetical protein